MPEISRSITKNLKASMFLKRELEQSARVERSLESRSLRIKKKLVEDRDRTLRGLLKSNREKENKGGASGLLGLLLGGGIGGALLRRGKPGGGGGLFSRFGRPKTPNTPGQLLRMQKGTNNLSRFSRFKKLGNIKGLKGNALINTAFAGVEFAGRKSSGQTNLQAGVGTGASVAGGILGAAIGQSLIPIPVLGALIGGYIGSSLTGGVADLVTGADRRRKFEEKRVLISSQKSMFSDSLDDFERILNKFESTGPFLAIRRDDDDPLPVRRIIERDFIGEKPEPPTPPTPPPSEPEPKTPFFQRPAFVIPTTAILTAAAFLLMAEPGDVVSWGSLAAFLKIKKVTTQAAKVKKTEKLMEELARRGFPGLSKKGIRVRIENAGEKLTRKQIERIRKDSLKRDKDILKNREIDQDTALKIKEIEGSKDLVKLRKDMEGQGLKIKDFLRSGKFIDEAALDIDQIERVIEVAIRGGKFTPAEILKKGKVAYDMILQNKNVRLNELLNIFKNNKVEINKARVDDMKRAIKMVEGAKDDFIRLFQKITNKNLKSELSDFDPTSEDIAMGGMSEDSDNIILLGSNGSKSGNTLIQQGGTNIAILGDMGSSPFDSLTKYAENMALLTT